MDNTIIQQGYFTSNGTNKTIVLRSDIDWMRVVNVTETVGTNNGHGFEYFWQREFSVIQPGMIYYHPAADHTVAVNMLTTGLGFSLVDSSTYALSAAVVTTAATNATQPAVSTGTTPPVGTIVRKFETVTPQYGLNGLDYTIGAINAGVSFTMRAVLGTAPGVAGGAGTYRIVAPDIATYKLLYPSTRNIARVTQAANGLVETLVDHGYAIGDKVRFIIPGDRAAATMTELNNQIGTIVTTPSACSFTVNIDTTGYTAFSFPINTAVPCLYPQVIPVGESANITSPLVNQGYIGMILTAGTASPAGSNGDVIKWVAGKSFNTWL